LAGVLSEKKINHVHSPWADKFSFIALIASRLLSVSYSVQARAGDIHRRKSQYGLREKFDNATFIITNSSYNEKYLRTILNKRNHKKIKTIYNGIDLGEFNPQRSKSSISANIRILSVARLVEQKGLVYLLKACRILKDRGYGFKCEIIGGQEEPSYSAYFLELKKLHTQLELEGSVFILGAQTFDKVSEKYSSSDIFVLPSVVAKDGDRDITPNSLIEAMAMKLPVISTTLSGIPEIVENDKNGLLVQPNNECALADAIIKLIEDKDLRIRLGENAMKKL